MNKEEKTYSEDYVMTLLNNFSALGMLKDDLEKENNRLKNECYKKRNENKSLRGTIKAISKKSNNRHNEIKRLLEKLEKLELKHKQLKDKVNQLEKELNASNMSEEEWLDYAINYNLEELEKRIVDE